MSNKNEFSPGQRVKFRVFPETGKPIQRGGIIKGPDTDHTGQMLVQGDQTPEDKADNRTGEVFSVWFAKGAGLVCGPAAPTNNLSIAGKGPQPMALIHRGPHSEAAAQLAAKVFGPQANAVTAFPLAPGDGTTVYPFQAAPEDLPALNAAIESDPSAAQHLAITDDPQLDDLEGYDDEKELPVLTAAK